MKYCCLQLGCALLLLSACSLPGSPYEGKDSNGETFWVDDRGVVTRIKKDDPSAVTENSTAQESLSDKDNKPSSESKYTGYQSSRSEEDFSGYVDSEQRLNNPESKGFYTWVDSLGVSHTSQVSVGSEQQPPAPVNKNPVELEPLPYIQPAASSPLILAAPIPVSSVTPGLSPMSVLPLKQVNDRYFLKLQLSAGVLSVLCINKADNSFTGCLDVVFYRQSATGNGSASPVYLPVKPVVEANKPTWKSYAKIRFSVRVTGDNEYLLVSFPSQVLTNSAVTWLLGYDARDK